MLLRDNNVDDILPQGTHLLSLEFISRIQPREHIALFYQDQMYADLIDSWYIQRGLDLGETCIFATSSEPRKIRERLMRKGIDVDLFESENILHILRINSGFLDIRGLYKEIETILGNLFSVIDPKLPARIVSEPWVGNLTTALRIEANMIVERNVQAAFQLKECEYEYGSLKEFKGSLICQYAIDRNNRLTKEWFHNHLLNHHNSITVPRRGPGIVFSSQKQVV